MISALTFKTYKCKKKKEKSNVNNQKETQCLFVLIWFNYRETNNYT